MYTKTILSFKFFLLPIFFIRGFGVFEIQGV